MGRHTDESYHLRVGRTVDLDGHQARLVVDASPRCIATSPTSPRTASAFTPFGARGREYLSKEGCDGPGFR